MAEANPRAKAVGDTYASHLRKYRDASYGKLVEELAIKSPTDRALSFDPSKVAYFDRIEQALSFTREEQQVYQRQGLVSVDHQQRHSMGSAYFAIYARDLPVLITSDSILHALHRSYDQILKTLEVSYFVPVIEQVLQDAHQTLERHAGQLKRGALRQSANDVDIYLSVARNLMNGAGAPDTTLVASRLDNDSKVEELLDKVAGLKLSLEEPTEINGGRRVIDYSQFRPRGHYTESEQLKRYFRAMMWLGRADTAFIVAPPDPDAGLEVDVQRETRGAALLTALMSESGGVKALARLSAIIDFMVGRADNASLDQMQAALAKSGFKAPADLADDALLGKIRNQLGTLSRQEIRSQAVESPRGTPKQTPPPQIVQVFGQRFVIDSFVLSKVVYDSIVFQGKKRERMLPSGLDVMAALGNDEAVRLLQPEIEKHQYAANLLAARKTVDEQPPDSWSGDLYAGWLDALRELDDVEHGHVPQVMQRQAWRRKQLQTQLASWSELRHDTILYAKQSYTAVPTCGYPAGFVEPYPEFFEKVQRFANRGADLLAGASIELDDSSRSRVAKQTRDRQVAFLQRFAQTMEVLAALARKELAAQPFTAEEQTFLRKTIDISGGGSGPPRYDGWYPRLIYGGEPDKWKPTVADVHTDPAGGQVLEEAVGDVNFLVVAVDNQGDRAAYVGPVYTYYEFTKAPSARMTNEAWQTAISGGKLPDRPSFTAPFRAKPASRHLPPVTSRASSSDPLAKRMDELSKQFSTASPDKRTELWKQIEELRNQMANPPLPKVDPKP